MLFLAFNCYHALKSYYMQVIVDSQGSSDFDLLFEHDLIFHNSHTHTNTVITHATSRPTHRGEQRGDHRHVLPPMRQTQMQTLEHMHIRSYKPTLGPRGSQDRWLPLVLLAVL